MSQYIYDINDLDFSKTYSYADYLLWKFKERVELFKGKVYKMSPAPSRSHQRTLMSVSLLLGDYFKNGNCEVFFAPFDVALFSGQNGDSTVVQPDLCVVCDSSKLDERGCHGAPDLIVEILSKGNSKKEIQFKYDLYEEAGVKEYWIIDYLRRTVTLHHLTKERKFQPQRMLTEGDTISSILFPSLTCEINDIFKNVPDRLGEPEETYHTNPA